MEPWSHEERRPRPRRRGPGGGRALQGPGANVGEVARLIHLNGPPAIGKSTFFKSIAVDGALPRKTFSMGHAKDKRFYMECRRISQ